MTAPIVIFGYNRLDELKRMVASLRCCYGASESDVYVFCDGPKNDADRLKTDALRKFVRGIDGFRSVTIKESAENKGLAPSIISGVTEIMAAHGRAIVVEDDLILSHNFLVWMNECLDRYADNKEVFSVSGFTPRLKRVDGYGFDAFFTGKAHSWGWATWADRWSKVDWQVADWEAFKADRRLRRGFNRLGNEMSGLLFDQMEGRKSSWWVRFCYSQFKLGGLTVYPVRSKVANDGFSSEATHCNVYNRYPVDFDKTDKKYFSLPDKAAETPALSRQFFAYYTFKSRLFGKLKTMLLKAGFIKQYSINDE